MVDDQVGIPSSSANGAGGQENIPTQIAYTTETGGGQAPKSDAPSAKVLLFDRSSARSSASVLLTPERIIERFGGGTVDDFGVLVRGPGHSSTDTSLRIFLSPTQPNGFWTHSFAGDNEDACRAHVSEVLGLAPGKRVHLTPAQKEEREAAIKQINEARAAKRKEKLDKELAIWDKATPVTAADMDPAWVSGQGNTKPHALVNTYLASRGLQIPGDDIFRWRKEFFSNAGKQWPGAMLARIVDPVTGALVGFHQTFIDFYGKKTTVEIPRGEGCEHASRLTKVTNKGVILLSRGDEGSETVAMGEGVETTLSLGLLPEASGAVLMSYVYVGNLKDMAIPKKAKIILLAVDIEPSGVGESHVKAYAARAAKEGKVVKLVYPTIPIDAKGKADLNDVTRAKDFAPGVGYRIDEIEGKWNFGLDGLGENNETSEGGEDELSPPEFSELALAHELNRVYGARIRYVDAWGKWYIFNGRVWKEDQTQRIYSCAHKICVRVAASLSSSSTAQKLARKITSSSCINAVVKIAQALPRIAATSDQWDADLWLLNTPKGVVDLHTGEMRKHDPNDYMTKITKVSPGGTCPRFLKFLSEITDDDEKMIAYLQRKNGYCLTGVTTEHAVFFIYGEGRNGKSVYLNTVSYVMGDYCTDAPITTFIVTNFEQHPTDLASLRGARMVRCSEVAKGQRWAEEKIKKMSGGDPVTARFMRQDFFTYDPQFKLEFIANVQPALRTVDEAAKARFQMIPFTVFIKPEDRDKNLETTLRGEAPGILQWMINGCLKWQEEGLAPPSAVIAASEAYINQQDVTEQWIEECCERQSVAPSTISKLWESWSKWATVANEFMGTLKDLKQDSKLKDIRSAKLVWEFAMVIWQ